MESRQPVASWQASQDEGWLIYNTLIVSNAPRKMGLEATASNKMRRTGIGVLQTICKGSHGWVLIDDSSLSSTVTVLSLYSIG